MNLDIGPVWRLLVDGDGFDNVGAVNVISSGSADGVVGSVQRNGARGGAGPGEVLVVADDGEDLLVGIGNSVDNGVGAGEIAVIAAIGGAGVVLSEDAGWQEQ